MCVYHCIFHICTYMEIIQICFMYGPYSHHQKHHFFVAGRRSPGFTVAPLVGTADQSFRSGAARLPGNGAFGCGERVESGRVVLFSRPPWIIRLRKNSLMILESCFFAWEPGCWGLMGAWIIFLPFKSRVFNVSGKGICVDQLDQWMLQSHGSMDWFKQKNL